jgi:hypothetical protein
MSLRPSRRPARTQRACGGDRPWPRSRAGACKYGMRSVQPCASDDGIPHSSRPRIDASRGTNRTWRTRSAGKLPSRRRRYIGSAHIVGAERPCAAASAVHELGRRVVLIPQRDGHHHASQDRRPPARQSVAGDVPDVGDRSATCCPSAIAVDTGAWARLETGGTTSSERHDKQDDDRASEPHCFDRISQCEGREPPSSPPNRSSRPCQSQAGVGAVSLVVPGAGSVPTSIRRKDGHIAASARVVHAGA